ncbi:hypothetical protein BC332_23907 [Capsicum chinense]|nr:hypothetical protein BC332_23907 [Capsicum chinense]
MGGIPAPNPGGYLDWRLGCQAPEVRRHNLGVQTTSRYLSTDHRIKWGCDSLPVLRQFPSLKFLSIRGMHGIIEWHVLGNGEFLALHDVTIKDFPKLIRKLLENLCRLTSLTISGCPDIAELVPRARDLRVDDCQSLTSLLILAGTENVKIFVCGNMEILSVAWVTPMMALRGLSIGNCEKLKSLPEKMHIPIITTSSTKKIEMFDEISIMHENDRARGECAKSFEDIDFDSFSKKDNDNDLEGPSIEKDVQVTETSQIKASRKRKCSFEVQNVVGDISIKFGEVSTAIGRMVDSRLDVTKLYEEVMAMEGYNEEFLGDAFDYWDQSDTLTKAFMVKN